MPARSGAQYIASLKQRQPEIYYQGERIRDVTTHPLFEGPIQAIAEQYDMQLDPAYREVIPKRTWSRSASTSSCAPTTTSAFSAGRPIS
jgi:aromatic ring hydroxylase